jgi:hypothetical protein
MLTTWHYPQKLALTSKTSGGRSVGIVRSQTEATDLFILRIGYSRGDIFTGAQTRLEIHKKRGRSRLLTETRVKRLSTRQSSVLAARDFPIAGSLGEYYVGGGL